MSHRSWSLCSWGATLLSWLNVGVAAVAVSAPAVPSGQALNFALVATGITACGGACVAVYKQFEAARLAVAQQWMDSQPGRFEAQIAELKVIAEESARRTEDANRKLHDLKDEANARELAHQAEVGRLQAQLNIALEQLRSANEELHAARMEIRRLMDATKRELQQGQAAILEEIQAQGGQS